MKTNLRFEEAMQLALAIFLYNELPFAGWIYLVMFLLPDVSMLGYLAGPRIGAYAYNFFHHKGFAIFIYLVGEYIKSDAIMFARLLFLRHSAFDRMLGYGLKYPDNFKNNHLGWLESNSKTVNPTLLFHLVPSYPIRASNEPEF